jgi:hypothetical protein
MSSAALRRRRWSRRHWTGFFLFARFRRIRRRLLQTLRIRLQPFGIRRALRLYAFLRFDRFRFVGLRTTGRRKKSDRQHHERKFFHARIAIRAERREQ